MDPRLAGTPACCCNGSDCAGRVPALAGRPADREAYAATEAIATSTGQNDAGLFELNFRDERYLPFEFAGAVSRWRIELPHENNQWPPETLSDFVMHLSFTAREGGDVLRNVANAEAQRHLPGAGVRLFDARNDFPDAWQAFQGQVTGDHSCRDLPLRLGAGCSHSCPGTATCESIESSCSLRHREPPPAPAEWSSSSPGVTTGIRTITNAIVNAGS